MSDWNQERQGWYPNAHTWTEDPRESYSTERAGYFPNQQYVGFNEFLNQIQQNGSYPAGHYVGNAPHPSYQNTSYNHMAEPNMPHINNVSTPSYAQIPSYSVENNVQHQYNEGISTEASTLRTPSAPFSSNLTPTATEFVPKSAQPHLLSQASDSSSSIKNGSGRSRDKTSNKISSVKSKSEVNSIPSSSSTGNVTVNGCSTPSNTEPTPDREGKRKGNAKGSNNSNKNKVKQVPKAPTTEDVGRTFYNSNAPKPSGSQDIRTKNQDVRYLDSQSKDNNRDNSDRDNNYRRENVSRDSYSNNFGRDRDNTTRDNYGRDINSRDVGNRENSRDSYNRDSQIKNVRNNQARDVRENSSRESRENRDSQINDVRNNQGRDHRDNTSRESRDNRDSKIQDVRNNQGRDLRDNTSREGRDNSVRETTRDIGSRENTSREYYNRERDSYSRDNGRDYYSRDSYNRDSYGRNRQGTQRVNRMERNAAEDEQYANSYLTYREERQDGRRPVTSEKLQLVPASPTRQKSTYKPRSPERAENTELTQRERLSEQLDRGVLECLVCCERVKQSDAVWSCGNCYHVLHLRCIRKWAMSSLVEGKWRCPACQNTSDEVPTEYLCFCGAMRAPEWVRGAAGAHGCGERCRRARACPHPCPLPCHPGPCPLCQATLNKKCGCGAETRSVVCSSKLEQVCGRSCGRKLPCGEHYCTLSCHEGDCEPCKETLEQVCHCPAARSRVVECSAATGGERSWACGEACGRVLACGAHVCRAPCHAPPCRPCHLLPDAVLTCPCGKIKLSEKEKRNTCTDPIPLCGNICAKPLTCGPPNDPHFCKLECHDGACPPCPDKTVMNCRCAHTSRDVDCVDVPQMIDNIFCTKKCNKKLSCGRHRCRELCCALESHRCPQVCGRTLSCGLHRCDNFCHTGHCPGCGRLGFSELRCECGASVLLPPVACGARPPACAALCARARACGHPPHHACHPGECPPCVVLTAKRCHGGHEERKTIPCHQEEFSCGLPCGKPLPCGKHTCNKLCHKGECATTKCVQQCTERRPGCGHPCGAPCHAAADEETPCPATAPCRLTVRATCLCGRRYAEKACADNSRDFAKSMSTLVASKMQDGSSVDLSDVTRPGANLKTLECDDECRVEARTRQMALVLQIRNPDTSSKLAPRYSEHVRQWAARDPAFAAQVHGKLSQLVQLAKKSKQKTRSHSFPSMNRQKRQFVHELCEHFGCESVAYDAEPNRNVVATADREKSWLPAMSVLEVLEREAGKRRVPGPMLRAAPPSAATAASYASASSAAATPAHANKSGGWATLTSKNSNAWGARAGAAAAAAPHPAPTPAPAAPARRPPLIDYFDDPPTN